MKRAFFSTVLLFTVTILCAQTAQGIDGSRDVPAPPVVSGLQAVITNGSVTLSWIPAPDITGESLIVRANRPITASNYSAAEKRGTVPYTVTTFTDALETGDDYYYAVLSRDSNGTLYEFFLPVSNSMLVGVSDDKMNGTAKETVFSSFDIMTRNDAVIITWKSTTDNRNLVLYRSTSPFAAFNSLVQAVVVATFEDTGTPYVDYPVPGVPYYYAVADEEMLRTGSVIFTAGGNTNRIPVEIPSGFARIQRTLMPSLRPMPLPYLNPSRTAPGPAWKFGTATENMIRSLVASPSARVPLRSPVRMPFIFRSDLESAAGGEEHTLKTILEKTFSTRSWEAALAALEEFLAIRRTAETTARTHFYRGEAYYFTGDYRKALAEFLLAQDQYYNQSREWIRYTMDRMVTVTAEQDLSDLPKQ